MSPFYFHRQFKAITGLTPKAYGAAHRAKKVRAELADRKTSVTERDLWRRLQFEQPVL